MKDILELPSRNANGKSNATERLGNTDIYAGDGVFDVAAEEVQRAFPSGSVAVLYDVEQTLAEDFARRLRAVNLKCVLCGADRRPPEYARFVVGVGAEDVAKHARDIAKEFCTDFSLVITEPSSDEYMDGAPLQVFVDRGIIERCSREAVAAGEGLIALEPLNRFEEYFRIKVLGEPEKTHVFTPSKERNSNLELAVELLRLSYDRQGREESAASVAARHLKRFDGKRLRGEYAFAVGSALSVLYADYLRAPSLDTLLPPDHFRTLAKIAALYTLPCSKVVERVDFLPFDDYFRINYILNEYRLDLLERLNGNDLRAATRSWRRLYPDAGYWLKTAIKASTVLNAVALAGETCKGLLGFIKASGALEGFIKAA